MIDYYVPDYFSPLLKNDIAKYEAIRNWQNRSVQSGIASYLAMTRSILNSFTKPLLKLVVINYVGKVIPTHFGVAFNQGIISVEQIVYPAFNSKAFNQGKVCFYIG